MTTHVFIVDEKTFRYHLQYMFAGTGARDKDVDFNDSSDSELYTSKEHAAESGLVAMMADCSRIRSGDYVIFYLQAAGGREGRFYGVFKAVGDAFLDRKSNPQYLLDQLGKNLTFRVRIEPFEVYGKGVTEWKALDEIRLIHSPYQMLWSLIYRKLKGNRGNTMITVYESERLIDLIRRENSNTPLPPAVGYSFYDGEIHTSGVANPYLGTEEPFNILPRLVAKHNSRKAHEAHLQMYITQNVGRNANLDQALGITDQPIEWIGNEVSCGVGMQRIDVMLSVVTGEARRVVMPIELKAVPAAEYNIWQINRYIEWIEQYYTPNRISTIQPVLLCLRGGLTPQLAQKFQGFNALSSGRYLPLRYIEYHIEGADIVFEKVDY